MAMASCGVLCGKKKTEIRGRAMRRFARRRIGRTSDTSNEFDSDVHLSVPLSDASAPSQSEVQNALTSLHQLFKSTSRVPPVPDIQDSTFDSKEGHFTNDYDELDNEGQVKDNNLVEQVSLEGLETDWAEPYPYNSRMLQVNGYDRVIYAIHLLQNDIYVQRMVKSLSCDKAVWKAMLNNEAVRELRESIIAEKESISCHRPNGTGNSDPIDIRHVIICIFDVTKTKLSEATAKIIKILCKLFGHEYQNRDAAQGPNLFDEKLRVCFMLSIMVILIVVVQRLKG